MQDRVVVITVRRQHHVVGFEITMDHTGAVRRDEHLGDLLGDRHRALPVETALDRTRQALALDQLEHEVVLSVVFDVVVDAADVRVIELGQHPRFAEEPAL